MKPIKLLDQVPRCMRHVLDEQVLSQYPSVIPSPDIEREIQRISVDELFAGDSNNSALARCALAGLWLLHGFLDRSHTISQSISTPEGSFWHAIMHRQEGDFWNSKYWYRQVGRHSVFQVVGGHLKVPNGIWEPAEFVDQCEAASVRSGDGQLSTRLKTIANAEWQALFQYCISPQ
jgi:hypothetical protein